MATTKKDLQYALERIAELTGQATSKEQAVEMGKGFYLWLDYASVYGGYRVVNVKVNSGAHFGALGGSSVEERLKASEMLRKLEGIEYGILYERRKGYILPSPKIGTKKI